MADGRSAVDGVVNTDALQAIISKDDRSVSQLALEIEVSVGYLFKILRGEKTPKLATALRLANALGCKIGAFYTVSPGLSSELAVLKSGAPRAS